MLNTIETAGWVAKYLEMEHNIYIYVLYVLIIIAAGWAVKGIEILVKKCRRKKIEKEKSIQK